MNALVYLGRKKLKNQLKSILKKPSRLIYVLFLVAMLILTLWGGRAADGEAGRVLRSASELNALATALYLLMFVLTVDGGFTRGGSLFSLPDVNLLFPAPIRPQVVLFHGLFQQMTASLFVGFFLLFQYTSLHGAYGITYGQLLLLLAGYGASVFLGQVTAMLLYSLTNGDEQRQRIGKAAFYCLIGGFVLYVLACALRGGRAAALTEAVSAINSSAFRWMPVIGWLSKATAGMLTGNPVLGLLGVLACAVYLCALVFLIFRVDPDYYEDVLKSAELSHSAITAKKEGGTEALPQKIRLGKTGLGRGSGADVFFYKHLLENRRARKFVLSTNALIFSATVILFSVFLREAGLLPTFLMAAYLQLFSSLLGRFHLELTRPYLYLVPEPPMKKLLWALAEGVPAAVLEGLVIFLPVGAILSLPPMTIVLCVVARVSLWAVYTAANVAVERIWGGEASRMLVFFLFFLIALVLAAPGVIAVCVLFFGHGVSAPDILLTVLTLGCLPMSLLALFLCRNMLQYAEMNNQ